MSPQAANSNSCESDLAAKHHKTMATPNKSPEKRDRRHPDIQSLKDIEKLEANLPVPMQPPRSIKFPEKQALWKDYCDYCQDRTANIRSDFEREGKTRRKPPRTFASFCEAYATGKRWHSATRRGRQFQSSVDRLAAEITDGKIVCDLGVSRTRNPKRHEVLYPDHVWQNADGSYSVASSKSRDFASFSPEQMIRQVKIDVDEAMQKYAGKLFVRRQSLKREMPMIEVTEIVLNYDPRLLPKDLKCTVKDLAEEYARAQWPNCFFQLASFRL